MILTIDRYLNGVNKTDRYHRLPSRRICLACVLVSQLAWLLPYSFIMLSQNSTPRTLIMEDRNASGRIHTTGFSGAVKVFQDHEVAALQKLYDEWNSFLPRLKETLAFHGFVQSIDKTCFLWLQECFWLAKHERILRIVTEAIGPRVLLYGMTVWKGKNEAFQQFHRNLEVLHCEKVVNFVFGASVQLVSQSHKVPERLFRVLLKTLQSVEEESFQFSDKLEEFDFLERSFKARVKRIIRSRDVWLENLELDKNHGVFFHGGTLHRIGEAYENKTGLLLQFISADCKLRDDKSSVWGLQGTSYSLYLQPTLLVAGDPTNVGAVNDVRTSLSQAAGLLSKHGNGNHSIAHLMGRESTIRNGVKASEISSVKVFSKANVTLEWEDKGAWRMYKIGEASTSVMAKFSIECLLLEHPYFLDFRNAAGDGDQVLVVLSEGLLYTRAIKDRDFQHYEVLELRPGSATLLSKQVSHTLVPLESETGVMAFHWIGHENIGSLSSSERGHAQITGFKSGAHLGTKATEGRTITLRSGQAYDPDNNEFCDVVVFVVEGYLLQVVPLNKMLQESDVLLIPAHQPCILWNVGGVPVKFFSVHVCRIEDEMQVITSFGASGKVF